MNRLLILDIDGVLKSIRSAIAFKDLNNMLGTSLAGSCKYPVEFRKESFNLDPICIQFIKNLVEDYDLKVVISSTWRIYSCIEHFHQMFRLYDWETENIIIDFTPCTKSGCRGEDVSQYIKNHPEVDDYIIIDDNNDFSPEQKNHLILTNMEFGFTHKDYEKAIELLEARTHDKI